MFDHYEQTERYNVLCRLTIKELFPDIIEHGQRGRYILEYENEEPIQIRSNISYIEQLNPLKKVWLLEADTTLGRFTE